MTSQEFDNMPTELVERPNPVELAESSNEASLSGVSGEIQVRPKVVPDATPDQPVSDEAARETQNLADLYSGPGGSIWLWLALSLAFAAAGLAVVYFVFWS